MMTLTIDIPALDRLCAWLESRDKTGLVQAIEEEIVTKLKEAAEGGVLEKAAKAGETVKATETVKAGETVKATETVQATDTSSVTADAATPSPQGEGSGKPVTLDAIQRAAAQMRDDGKLKAVTDMFPEFGIKKLSDLKGEALQGFADRLRDLGAKI